MPKIIGLLLVLLSVSALASTSDIDSGDDQLDALFQTLLSGNFADKGDALSKLAQSSIPNKSELIKGVLEGSLRLHKKSRKLVWTEKQGRDFSLQDAMGEADLGIAKKRELKKFGINNQLRKQIKSMLATVDLGSDDPAVRMQALRRMMQSPEPIHAELLLPLLEAEPDQEIRQLMDIVVALAQLKHADPAQRRQAIQALTENLQPAVRNQLKIMAAGDKHEQTRELAAKVVKIQDKRVKFFGYIETLFFGLSLGSVLVLAAIGLAITFGVMGVINMAHGELIMLGAYTTYLMQITMPGNPGLALVLSVPAAFIVSGCVGIAIERGVIRFLYGRTLETLLATFGVSLILQQLVRTFISPQNVPVSNPSWMSGLFEFNSVLSVTYSRLYILLFCLFVFALLALILKKTTLGLQVRAVSQNRAMARAMGVNSARVDALTFGLGSAIAGVAGVALSQLTNVGPNLGQAYIVDSFMVVVFGGVGNLWGTLVGGMTLGIMNKFMEPWAGAVLAKILVLVFIILFIQKRPRGLFPQTGRAAES